MKLQFYRNLWGVPEPRETSILRIADLGYHGVEAVIFNHQQARELAQLLSKTKLEYKGVIWTRGTTLKEVQNSFSEQLNILIDIGASSISVIGGYDCWNPEERRRYFEFALETEANIQLPVAHETHRNSVLFHPSIAQRIIKEFPQLKIVCDLSHWVVCAERLIDDQIETIRMIGRRTEHLHVRVGTEQAPQVADVRSTEAQPYRRAFEKWWMTIWDEQKKSGKQITTACPELGPPPYQIVGESPENSVAELWLQCEWQRENIARLFSHWIAQNGFIP